MVWVQVGLKAPGRGQVLPSVSRPALPAELGGPGLRTWVSGPQPFSAVRRGSVVGAALSDGWRWLKA